MLICTIYPLLQSTSLVDDPIPEEHEIFFCTLSLSGFQQKMACLLNQSCLLSTASLKWWPRNAATKAASWDILADSGSIDIYWSVVTMIVTSDRASV